MCDLVAIKGRTIIQQRSNKENSKWNLFYLSNPGMSLNAKRKRVYDFFCEFTRGEIVVAGEVTSS